GRGDRRGALRFATFIFVGYFVSVFAIASHVPTPSEFAMVSKAIAHSLLMGAIAWLLYMGIEPILRKNSPRSIVSWTRVLAGRFRDPLVDRGLLIGAIGGGVMVGLGHLAFWLVLKDTGTSIVNAAGLTGLVGLVAAASGAPVDASLQTIGYLVLWQVLSLGLRSPRRGAVALALILSFGLVVANGPGALNMAVSILIGIWLAFFFTTFGLLASATMHGIFLFALSYPMTFNPRIWFFGDSLIGMSLGALPAIYGAWVAARLPAGSGISTRKPNR